MKRKISSVAATALVIAATRVFPFLAAAQASSAMGGGYANVTTIPVNDPMTKNIVGDLFTPAGAGPFPVVIYVPGCGGRDHPPVTALENGLIDHLLARGVATFMADSGGPLAAVSVLEARPEIDPNRVFLQGYSCGATAALAAVDTKKHVEKRDAKIAGVIAFFPKCYADFDPSVPTLVLIGEKDDRMPPAPCQAVKDKPNYEVVVFPGATHGFVYPSGQPIDLMGHHIVYDEKATLEAQRRVDAFIAARLSPK
jgi:dienelactone hydrolase